MLAIYICWFLYRVLSIDGIFTLVSSSTTLAVYRHRVPCPNEPGLAPESDRSKHNFISDHLAYHMYHERVGRRRLHRAYLYPGKQQFQVSGARLPALGLFKRLNPDRPRP